jgi:hypothetical protein
MIDHAQLKHPRWFDGSYVYAIRCGDYVKVGVAKNPMRRLSDLQTAVPYRLELIGLMVGGFEVEKRLHRLMAESHHRGEWFELNSSTRYVIDANMATSTPAVEQMYVRIEKAHVRPGLHRKRSQEPRGHILSRKNSRKRVLIPQKAL